MGNAKTIHRRQQRERAIERALRLIERRNQAAAFVLNHAPDALVDEILKRQERFKKRRRALTE